jgi:hypothetical protein
VLLAVDGHRDLHWGIVAGGGAGLVSPAGIASR